MPRRYSMAKRGRATVRTRRRIELALIELLAARPYSAISANDIATRAAISVRTIQRQYASKDDILAACVSFQARALADDLAARPPASSLREALRDFVEALFAFYKANSEQAWAVYSRSQDVPVLNEVRNGAIGSRESLIDQLYERWPDGWSTNRRKARAAILGLTSFGTWSALTDAGRFTPEDAAEFTLGALERTLLK